MSDIKVTQEQIDQLLNSADVRVDKLDEGGIIVSAKPKSGFTLAEAALFGDAEVNRGVCLNRMENELRKMEEYALMKQRYEKKTAAATAAGETAVTDFGWAIRKLRCGFKLRRRGWNGKGIFIALQEPDAHSKMTSPYIYIDTTGLQTSNTEAPRSCVPWLASQTDMLAEDWEIVT